MLYLLAKRPPEMYIAVKGLDQMWIVEFVVLCWGNPSGGRGFP